MPNEPQYDIINQLELDAYERGAQGLSIDTMFMGKISSPNLRGAIKILAERTLPPARLPFVK